MSYRRDSLDSTGTFVAHISLVKGVPFYGYHVGYRFFLKIYLLNPSNIVRLADLLRQGAVMKRAMQPFESHVQYIPQWMSDYNLYGCDYMDCVKVAFRNPVPEYAAVADPAHQWHDVSISTDWMLDETQFPRQSHCDIEVDVCVHDIANRLATQPRNIHQDFVDQTNAFSNDAKLVQSMAGLWRDETRRRKLRMGLKDPKSSPFPPEVLVSVSADPRSTHSGGWIHEEEFRQRLGKLARHERETLSEETGSFETFIHPHPLEASVQTAFESVEELHPSKFPPKAFIFESSAQHHIDAHPLKDEIEVDETRILSLRDNDRHWDPEGDTLNVLPMLKEEQLGFPENLPINGSQKLPSSQDSEHDEQDSARLPVSQGSSELLQSAGIREAGDFSHVQEDAFAIPPEFIAAVAPVPMGLERQKRPLKLADAPQKRRKLLSDLQYHALTSSAPSNDKNQSNGEVWQSSDQCAIVNANSVESLVNQSLQKTGNASQDKSTNSRLNFSVVKDPRDPSTAQRLSQQSNGSAADKSPSKRGKLITATSQSSKANDNEAKEPGTRSVSAPSLKNLHLDGLPKAFDYGSGVRLFYLAARSPPLLDDLRLERDLGIGSILHQDAHYGNEEDVPERIREYAGREFKLESNTVPYLPAFEPSTSSNNADSKMQIKNGRAALEEDYYKARTTCTLMTWEYKDPPPTRLEVERWLARNVTGTSSKKGTRKQETVSQIEGATQKNKHGFKYSQKKESANVWHETQYMSSMSLEVHVNTEDGLIPNPEKDEIACIFWCLNDGEAGSFDGETDDTQMAGILVLSQPEGIAASFPKRSGLQVREESDELDLINRMIDIVREHDPDILTGFEVHNGSWGYLIERARVQYEFSLYDELSRVKSQSHGRFGREADRWGFNQTSTIRVAGRHMINIWRAMRGELNLLQYTLENIVFHTLHRRVPHYSFADLTTWYQSGRPRDISMVIDYFVTRTRLDLEILQQNELVPRTSEQARLVGIDFFAVFSRGSQFKVESLMFRIAKPESLLLISPSRKQVGGQNALECLPLVMEPQSAFYSSPVLVLDFQSLYPSVMIAYNYCYSTFLGRVVNWRGSNKMGFTDFAREPGLLGLLEKDINTAPNGVMYVKPSIRKSLLAKMLGEILETRVMVKSGMKVDKDDKTLQRLLNNRQLALKLIANVTYGYTSASFSGRMPCSEIADSIVQTGRETLEKAIALIHSVNSWGAEVVYGDTDSLFVHLKGRTRAEAFDMGEQIAKAVTNMNPRPVKLKFEKVYHPCVLLAKKRYVGFKYESKTQKEPEFEAKGIETVRRDGTPAEQKIEEKALKTLFRTADLSEVKFYFQRQCEKIMRGKVSVQDFCYAREVKLGTYSDKGPPPPGALISTRKMHEDPRAEPQYGERVPYVVIAGAPGARLIDRCVAPEVLLQNDHHELDAEYYISKNIIPPLERIFGLVGGNGIVRSWYDEMPKYHRIRQIEGNANTDEATLIVSKKTLESYMKSSSCVVCKNKLEEAEIPLCTGCLQQTADSLLKLRARLAADERRASNLDRACRSCSGTPFGEEVRCNSKDCPVFYSRTRHRSHMGATRATLLPIVHILEAADGIEGDW